MIKVTIEILPKGCESEKFTHSVAYIWNTGAMSRQTGGIFGDYRAEFMQSHHFNPKKVWKKSYIKGVHRKNRGVWDIIFCLLYRAGLFKRNKAVLNGGKEG